MYAARQLFKGALNGLSPDEAWQAIGSNYAVSEQLYIEELLPLIHLPYAQAQSCQRRAQRWIQYIRDHQHQHWGVEPLLQEFSLDSQEGIALMSLAEALIRIPDSNTADALIADRIQSANWDSPDQDAELWLQLSNRALHYARQWYEPESSQASTLNSIAKRMGEPVLRRSLQKAVLMLANRFVMGESIYEALDRSQSDFDNGNSFSFDMLGEAALCAADCDSYFNAYLNAIHAVGKNESYPKGHTQPSVSIKLSALHSRFEALQGEAMLAQLVEQVSALIEAARKHGVPLTLDAEEADRLEPTLTVFARLYQGVAQGWGQLGLAVQAYSKRALPTLAWLQALATQQGDSIPVRLVKGAYWDAEIKQAQQLGLKDYPVFTLKSATDISYLACARYLLSEQNQHLMPQFATHNAETLSQIIEFAQTENQALTTPFECQRLYGMGAALYEALQQPNANTRQSQEQANPVPPCRTYAPVGNHRELLPYLVRRLLENGANSSFVNQVTNLSYSAQQLSLSAEQLWQDKQHNSPAVPPPTEIFQPRRNSRGLNLNVENQRRSLLNNLNEYRDRYYLCAPLIDGVVALEGESTPRFAPFDTNHYIGDGYHSSEEHVIKALDTVTVALKGWRTTEVEQRCLIAENIADQYETHAAELIHLLQMETGKTLADSLDEVREAVDFCRYYAQQARGLMTETFLPAVTGEHNRLSLTPRGLFACISPWNFPLAIFTGQIVAALVTGNGVIAKPAQQTALIAYRASQLFLDAGVPADIFALLPGPSRNINNALWADPRIAGVAFTGSSASAKTINQQLAARPTEALAKLVAETGGQNVMIVDSTALPQQVVRDVIHSAFTSCGQRCSALRVLYVQEEVADEITELLMGAMDELKPGSPDKLSTDLGPVIDEAALAKLSSHIGRMHAEDRILHQTPLSAEMLRQGHYIAPTLVKLERLEQLDAEHFGPVLHLIRYPGEDVDSIIDDINASGYGLTLGIHSRNEHRIAALAQRAQVGNIYINRNQVGAVVGAQPFGGQKLSGTGPKAGGPHYLLSFVYEKTVTTNTTAWGGNLELLTGQ